MLRAPRMIVALAAATVALTAAPAGGATPPDRGAGGLDDHNRTRPGSTTTLSLWVEKYTPESIRSVTLQASDDDGRTWRDVVVRRTAGGWQATVTNPASVRVSLRAGATGSAGSGVGQAVPRAWAIG